MTKRPKNLTGDQNGSFLLEALLAVVIVGISLTLISRSLSANLRANQYVAGYTRAIVLAENKLFELRNRAAAETLSNQKAVFEEPFEQFSCDVAVTSRKDPQDPDEILEAALTVTWDAGPKPKTLKAATLFYPLAKTKTESDIK